MSRHRRPIFGKVLFQKSLLGTLTLALLLGFQNCGPSFAPSEQYTSRSASLSKDSPEIVFLTGPSAVTNSTTHVFAVALQSVHSGAVKFFCKVDNAAEFAPCSAYMTIADLPDGVHEFSVMAVDAAGLESPVIQHSWTQDRVPPSLVINQAPPAIIGTTQTSLAFSAFDALSGVAGLECSLDGATYSECQSPLQLMGLSPGDHSVSIRARDKAGNLSAPVSANWRITLGVPTVSLISKPNAVEKLRSASFTFSGTDGRGGQLGKFECKVDSGAFSACTSPRALSNLSEGLHSFELRGTDSLGATSSPVTYSWRVDSIAPTITISSGPSGTITTASATFAFTVSESGSGIQSIYCSIDSGAAQACTNTKAYSNLPSGSHTFVIDALDVAGNASSVQRTFTVALPTPTPAPSLDGVQLYVQNCAGCHGSISTTTKRGASIDRINVAISSVPTMSSLASLTVAQRQAIADALSGNNSGSTQPVACAKPNDVGGVAMQRLNQKEYRNTIRAITGISLPPDASFPTEEAGEFPNVSRILILNPVQMAWYLDTSMSVINSMMGNATLKAQLVNCDLNVTSCWQGGVGKFAELAYRRPPESAEITRLHTLFNAQKTTGLTSEESFKVVLQTILISPQFLYRNVKLNNPTNPTTWEKLDAYELATRMAYFIWGESPDAALYSKAKTGQLLTPSVLKAEVDRLMADDRAAAQLSQQFMSYWWGVYELPSKNPDKTKFPEFTAAVKADLAIESELVFKDLIKNNGKVGDLLTGQTTYLNENLARFYGIAGLTGAQFRKVSLVGTDRTGVLTHGSVMTTTSHSNSTSIVRRGAFVATHLQCIKINDPPPGVGSLPPNSGQTSIRSRLEAHRNNPTCASCHNVLDPPGFGLENFNAIGLFRTKDDDGYPLDTAGTLVSGKNFSNPIELAAALVSDQDFHRCASSKMMSFALGRTLEPYDECMVNQISNLTTDKPIRDLVYQIIVSDTFQYERGD